MFAKALRFFIIYFSKKNFRILPMQHMYFYGFLFLLQCDNKNKAYRFTENENLVLSVKDAIKSMNNF